MDQDIRQNSIFTYKPSDVLLDGVNVLILRELQLDPRLTMAALGRRIGMSSPAVTERVRRLEESGIIRGYRLDLAPEMLGLQIAAYIRIRPNPGQLGKVSEFVRCIPEIVACDRITGEDCFLLKVHIPAMDLLDRLLDRLLAFGTTTTSIVQSSPVPLRSMPLPVADADQSPARQSRQ
ncbi:MAG TPA: Lrp/AsnC family transcriptional regulator [Thermomicrobiales bacterium]|nr:Lrp/AsnC family transcriptional regulator [Thermomicrobiales bacterium]